MGQNMGETVRFKVEKDTDIDAREILKKSGRPWKKKDITP